eukprot:5241015-Amphidinium_carterae.1
MEIVHACRECRLAFTHDEGNVHLQNGCPMCKQTVLTKGEGEAWREIEHEVCSKDSHASDKQLTDMKCTEEVVQNVRNHTKDFDVSIIADVAVALEAQIPDVLMRKKVSTALLIRLRPSVQAAASSGQVLRA